MFACLPVAMIAYLLSTGLDNRWSALVSRTKDSQVWRPSRECELTLLLADGWRAEWKGETLWLTHYNPDGRVADSLPFHSVEHLHAWVEAHPDCCDVDVDKDVREQLGNAVTNSTAELIQ